MDTEKKKVMVVDDMPTILEQARQVAGDAYQLIPAISGIQALEILEKITPDIILLDIYMPQMDGFECLAQIKNKPKWKDIPIIIITTDSSVVTETKGFALGAADFIRKPFTEEIMFKRINMQLELVEYKKMLAKNL